MSPTIVIEDGCPLVAVGAAGGATIITTIAQILIDVVDFGGTLPEALAAPRLSQRGTPSTEMEGGLDASLAASLLGRGHVLATRAEIGAATGIAFHRDGTLTAVAEPTRRGGGAAMVVEPIDEAARQRLAPRYTRGLLPACGRGIGSTGRP